MIKLTGNSVFNVCVVSKDNKLYIEKSSNSENFKRLEKQINKQKEFYRKKIFNIPKIIKNYDNSFLMEYINGDSIIEYLLKSDKLQIEWLINEITKIIDSFISSCEYRFLNENILLNKINDIKNKINENKFVDNDFINIFHFLESETQNIKNIKFPVNICHGDLTLCNILIKNKEKHIFLIDFLDSFLESPIVDMVKVRQDTKYKWCINMFIEQDKINDKVEKLLDYCDLKFHNHFQKYNFYSETYKYFQIINLLRVLQYSKDKKISDSLTKNIFDCFN